MSSSVLSKLTEKLPNPEAVYKKNGVVFNIYKAKGWQKKEWESGELEKLVSLARKSYYRYGSREIYDKYDDKACIFLVSAEYKSPKLDNEILIEWISIRFVPGQGRIKGANELEIYYYAGKSLDKIVKEKFFGNSDKFWDYIVSSSRLCGIEPYIKNNPGKIISPKHKYTAISFALAQKQFIDDCHKTGSDFKFITEIVRTDFMKKAISIKTKNGKRIGPPSMRADKTLEIKNPRLIKLDRSIYSYKFPNYWLNIYQLDSLLQRLIRNKLLSKNYKKYYPEHSKILNIKGKISDSKLTGNALRSLVDKYVSDSPGLKITDFETWTKGIDKMVICSGAKKIS